MKKSSIQPMPPFFDRYINLIEDIDIFEAFKKYAPVQVYAQIEQLQALGDLVYAPGKWTVKDILQHVIDNERIMAYRALRFSRGDKTALAGYEEELLAANTMAANRSVADLMTEFELVRAATIPLFKNMSESMLLNVGTANETQITPLALGFVILGHPVHHMRIIRERYFPLL
ncbi:DinB family protein [Dyadobacter aurulentus]|uniref:DinB family protein n=1 Tax=Dyadobacter sp. UC 10 TaxID=2605428 RepID=UPI0011F23D97|nr:DinB family protein [Dyadobacter sp. UC 10]KAA0988940.1 DinB family protein [Dyadobacter sp. UC 10]